MRKQIFQDGGVIERELSRVRSNAAPVSVLQCALALFSLSLLVLAQPPSGHKTLRTIHDVTQLSNIDARNTYPVQLEGVATYSDPEWGLLFLEDATGAIYVNVHGMDAKFPAGSRLRVDAVTGPGDVGTVLVNPKIQVLGQGTMPAPEHRSLAELNTRATDSRFVQVRGVLRAGDQPWDRVCFRVFDGDVSALVVIPEKSGLDARRLAGATVHLRGVSGVHIDAKGRILGAMLFVNQLSDIEVESGGAKNPNALAVIVNKHNPMNDLSMAELRRVLLGERKYWTGSKKIVLLLPGMGSPERATTLRLVAMDESGYKQLWQAKTSSGDAETPPAASPASGIAISLVADAEDAIAIVPLADVRGSVKILKIDGYLPSDSAYPVH